MKTKGIRISDCSETNNDVVSVELHHILEEIYEGAEFHWSILYLDSMGQLKNGRSISDFENEIEQSETGLWLKWEELKNLATKFYQIYDLLLIGCKDISHLHRYQGEKELCETCDISIEMFDCSYWEVFSKNRDFIDRLEIKFKDTELLGVDHIHPGVPNPHQHRYFDDESGGPAKKGRHVPLENINQRCFQL